MERMNFSFEHLSKQDRGQESRSGREPQMNIAPAAG
jgi:hypothetical protein